MTITTVYKTSDGETFTVLAEAEDHEKNVQIWDKVLEKYGTYGELNISYLSDFLEVMNYIQALRGE